MPRRRDYNPWEVPDDRYQAMPKREQQWVRELKVRRRLYQVAAVLPLIGWPLYLLMLMVQELQQSTSLGWLFSFFGIIILAAVLSAAATSAVLQLARNRGLRIAGYILGGLLNLGAAFLTVVINNGNFGSSGSMSWTGGVVLFLILLSCAGSFILIIANLKLAPYLEAENEAKRDAEDDEDDRRRRNRLPPEPDSKW